MEGYENHRYRQRLDNKTRKKAISCSAILSRFVYTITAANYRIPYSLEQRCFKGNIELKFTI